MTQGTLAFEEVAESYAEAWQRSTNLVFASPTWLQAVGTERFRILRVGGPDEPPAYLPIAVTSRLGLTSVANPPLTPWLHPATDAPGNNEPARISTANRVGREIAEQLPRTAAVKLRFHPTYPSFLGFHWSDYLTLARISYRVDAMTSDEAWGRLRGELRTDLRRAERDGVVADANLDPATASAFLQRHADASGFDYPFDEAELAAFLDRVLAADLGRLWEARVDGTLVGAALVVHDPSAAYYLVAASSPEGRPSKAMALLVWSALKDALDAGRAFDFTGSMLHGVERFNRSFGGHQVTDVQVVRPPLVGGAVKTVRSLARRVTRTR